MGRKMLSDTRKILALVLVMISVGCHEAQSPKGFGETCTQANGCASGFCAANGQCCAAGESSNVGCGVGTVCQKLTGACGLPDGSTTCKADSECAPRRCKERGFCAGKAGPTVECTDDDAVCADPFAG